MKNSNNKFSLVCMGGGAGAFLFLEEGGWSQNFVRGTIPYSAIEFKQYKKIVCKETTEQIALIEWQKLKKDFKNDPCIAIVVNSALARIEGERPDRENISYIVIQKDTEVKIITIKYLNKDRAFQETLLSGYIRHIINGRIDNFAPSSVDYEVITTDSVFINGREMNLWNQEPYSLPKITPNIIFPGSFNPFHDGHLNAIKIINQETKQKTYLEVSINNIDKPTLTFQEYINRYVQLEKVVLKHNEIIAGVIFTNQARIIHKLKLFNGVTDIVCGFDTIKRFNKEIQDSNFLGVEHEIFKLKRAPTFYVIHRNSSKKDELTINYKLRNLCKFFIHSTPELSNISSTKIRAKNV